MVLDGATHRDTVRAEQHAAVVILSREDLQSVTDDDQRALFQVRMWTGRWVTRRARWVTLRARWVTLRARWVTLRARRVTLRAR
jgi:hypothetical protein